MYGDDRAVAVWTSVVTDRVVVCRTARAGLTASVSRRAIHAATTTNLLAAGSASLTSARPTGLTASLVLTRLGLETLLLYLSLRPKSQTLV